MLLLWGPLLAAVVLLPVVMVGAIILAIARVRRRGAWLGLVGVPLGRALAPAALLLLLFGASALHQTVRPSSWTYKDVFGAKPGPAIKRLRARTDAGLDYSTIYLAFDRSPAALAEALASGGFRPPDPASARIHSLASDAPDWWRSQCTDARALERAGKSWDNISVIDCPSERRMYVVASNLD